MAVVPVTRDSIRRLRTLIREAGHVQALLRLLWPVASGRITLIAVLWVAQALMPAVVVVLTGPLVDAVTRRQVAPGVVFAGLMAAALVLLEALRAMSGYVRTQLAGRMQDHIMDVVHGKSVELDLSFYDSAEFFDRLHRAQAEAAYRPVALLDTVGNLFRSSVTLMALVGVLVSFGWWVPVALLAGAMPALWVVVRHARRQQEFRLRTTTDERRTWYFSWLLTAREPAPELRLFGLGPRYRERYRALQERLRGEREVLARGELFTDACAVAIALGVTGVSLGWMLWLALAGTIGLGSLVMFYQAFQHGLGLARTLLDEAGQMYSSNLFLSHLFEFLALQPALADPVRPSHAPSALSGGIRFDRVTFQYPGAIRPALRGVTLTIPTGGIVAFVGPNGSGKSTIVKLLCRFYDPAAGRILIDDVDVRDLAQDELRSRISAVFQEPVRYNDTAAGNIALHDRPLAADLAGAASAAAADEVVAALPAGYESLLGKLFLDGAELSAGQWQRVALARALYRRAPVLLLDEPTSAIDPWAEAEWLERLREIAEGRTTVLITHRFTTAMRADLIYVLADGAVVESGSHAELLAHSGLYAQSWREQTQGPLSGAA